LIEICGLSLDNIVIQVDSAMHGSMPTKLGEEDNGDDERVPLMQQAAATSQVKVHSRFPE
jgi:hypothetical protein